MAKVLGASGRYVSQEATKRLHSIWRTGIVAVALLGCICGFMLRASFPWFTLPPLSGIILTALLLVLFLLIGRRTFQRMDQLEKERGNWLQGARGEKSVGFMLSKLPEGFCVINDISTSSGNLDHVVVGPTGVFIIETKNCRGVIDADRNGELTWNGKPAKQQPVGTLLRRTMAVKAKVRVLAPGVDPFFNAVMVFTSAWVDVGFGRTGAVHCLPDDELLNYILNKKASKALSKVEVGTLARAFAGLAGMGSGFREQPSPGKEAEDALSTVEH